MFQIFQFHSTYRHFKFLFYDLSFFVSSISGILKNYGQQLKAPAAMVRLRLCETLLLLHPQYYESKISRYNNDLILFHNIFRFVYSATKDASIRVHTYRESRQHDNFSAANCLSRWWFCDIGHLAAGNRSSNHRGSGMVLWIYLRDKTKYLPSSNNNYLKYSWVFWIVGIFLLTFLITFSSLFENLQILDLLDVKFIFW